MLEAGLHIRNLCGSKSHDCDHFGIFRDTWGTCIFKLKLVFTLNKKEIFSWNFYPDKLNNIPQEFAHLGCMSHCVCYHCNYKFLAIKKGTAWEAEYDRSRCCDLCDLPPRVKRQESALSAVMPHPSLCSLLAVTVPTGHPVRWELVYLSLWAHRSQPPVDNQWQLSRVAFKGCTELSSLSKLSIPSAGTDSWCLTFNNKQTTRRRTWRRV